MDYNKKFRRGGEILLVVGPSQGFSSLFFLLYFPGLLIVELENLYTMGSFCDLAGISQLCALNSLSLSQCIVFLIAFSQMGVVGCPKSSGSHPTPVPSAQQQKLHSRTYFNRTLMRTFTQQIGNKFHRSAACD